MTHENKKLGVVAVQWVIDPLNGKIVRLMRFLNGLDLTLTLWPSVTALSSVPHRVRSYF